ncbi:16S rRNA (cytosine(1402)-N(4))-methyltransferase RsmH [Fibrobacterota bacterium]
MITRNEYHVPVLLGESIEGLAIKPDGIYLDCTLGGGGHYRKLAEMLDKEGIAIGIDRDPEALTWVHDHPLYVKSRVLLEQSKFSEFNTILKKHSIKKIDGVLIDLGLSSRQVDDPHRGFSYKADTPLDMRMDPQSQMTAEKIIAESSEEELTRILKDYGEIGNPQRMASAIARFSRKRRIATSGDLRECIESEYGAPVKYKVLSKLFQALRIAVNNELEELGICLHKAVVYLNKGGRLVVIAYHSLEDRIVKNFMRDFERRCVCQPFEPICTCNRPAVLKRINRKAIRASANEIRRNQRARSAVLRICEKVV